MNTSAGIPRGAKAPSGSVIEDGIGETGGSVRRNGEGRPVMVWFAYAVVGFLGAIGVVYFFEPWAWAQGGVFPGGGDLLWVQAMAQVHQQVGPLGVTDHLGWPNGFSPWSTPQLGLLFGLIAWATGLVGIGSAKASLGALAVAGALNAMGCMYFFRSVVKDRLPWGVAALSVACAISPFVITKLGHYNVAAFYMVPITVGVAIRAGDARETQRWILAAAVVFAGVLSPAWWVVVSVLFMASALGASLIGARWRSSVSFGVAAAAATVALAVQWVIQSQFKDPGERADRGPWDSNVYGGHLVDLFLGSPLLNSRLTFDDALIPGASVESSPLGLILSIAAVLSVVLVIAVFPWGAGDLDKTFILRTTTTVALVFFLLGGLGNLQAGVAVVLGGESPARVWARMALVLGLLGTGWLLLFLARRRPPGTLPRWVSVCTILVLAFVTLAEASSSPELDAAPQQAFSEFEPVKFIESVSPPCPVAQLPQDDFPIPRALPDRSGATIDNFYFRGFIPYLMSPNYYWSFTSWNSGAVNDLQDLTTEFNDKTLAVLQSRGFCAVLFDLALSDAAKSMNVPLEGRDVTVTREPDFAGVRFNVYLLDSIPARS